MIFWQILLAEEGLVNIKAVLTIWIHIWSYPHQLSFWWFHSLYLIKGFFLWYWWWKCCCFTCPIDPDVVERACSARQYAFSYITSLPVLLTDAWEKNSSAWKLIYIAHDAGDLVIKLPFDCGNPSHWNLPSLLPPFILTQDSNWIIMLQLLWWKFL